VSQGGEGRIRRVTPEENRRLVLAALREGRCDIARQAGWDLAVEQVRALCTSSTTGMVSVAALTDALTEGEAS
jgi:hypothetical protein